MQFRVVPLVLGLRLCRQAEAVEPVLQLASFRVDVTPPQGVGPCVRCRAKVTNIKHPLELRGIVLQSGGNMFVLSAMDYCGISHS